MDKVEWIVPISPFRLYVVYQKLDIGRDSVMPLVSRVNVRWVCCADSQCWLNRAQITANYLGIVKILST